MRALLKLSNGLNEVARADQIRSHAAVKQEQQSNDESDYYEIFQSVLSPENQRSSPRFPVAGAYGKSSLRLRGKGSDARRRVGELGERRSMLPAGKFLP
jgi:hypothetical protein